MKNKYKFKYHNCNIQIINNNLYDTLYLLRDINMFWSLHKIVEKNVSEQIIKNEKSINHLLNYIQVDLSLEYGLCGFGYMYFYMSNYSKCFYMNKTYIDRILIENIDKVLNNKIPIMINDKFNTAYDYYTGLLGIFGYLIQCTDHMNIKIKIFKYIIDRFNELDLSNNHNFNLSNGHGFSSFFSILKLSKGLYTFSKNELSTIKKIILHIEIILEHRFKVKDKISLSWGSGDFGILYSLFTLLHSLDLTISKNLITYYLLVLNKGDKIIFSKLNTCNGAYGFIRMYEQLKTISAIPDFDIPTKIFSSKKNNTILKEYTSREFSIIDGILSRMLYENVNQLKSDDYFKLFLL